MKHGREYKLTLSNGTIMNGAFWPCLMEAEANLIIVTGMAESSYRYDEFAYYLNQHNIGVYCIDHYGQGYNAKDENEVGIWPKDGFTKAVQKGLDYSFNHKVNVVGEIMIDECSKIIKDFFKELRKKF
mgnify:CR=1 FL=1